MPLESKHFTTPVMSKKAKKRVSRKIAHLIKTEGKTPKQAAGQAYGMERSRKKKSSG